MPQPDAAVPTQAAATLIQQADGLLITAGAGLGVDSGLPDFRGTEGLWKAYPALRQAGLDFSEIACPKAFQRQPTLAWGFYGHRLNLYRRTQPHHGFTYLRNWATHKEHGAFVFTSNVDGHFQKAGFSTQQVMECHGSVHWLQCLRHCGEPSWSAEGWEPMVDEARCQLLSALPHCPRCGGLARPNVLMFDDPGWQAAQSQRQHERLDRWLSTVSHPVVIELGAGTAIPSVRWFGTSLGFPLIRINLREPALTECAGVSLADSALGALTDLNARLA